MRCLGSWCDALMRRSSPELSSQNNASELDDWIRLTVSSPESSNDNENLRSAT